MPKARVEVSALKVKSGQIEVVIDNPGRGPVAFFNRISLVNGIIKKEYYPFSTATIMSPFCPGRRRRFILTIPVKTILIMPKSQSKGGM